MCVTQIEMASVASLPLVGIRQSYEYTVAVTEWQSIEVQYAALLPIIPGYDDVIPNNRSQLRIAKIRAQINVRKL